MIELKVTGCCKGCEYMSLELLEPEVMEDDDFFGNNRVLMVHGPILRCEHAAVCKKLDKEKRNDLPEMWDEDDCR